MRQNLNINPLQDFLKKDVEPEYIANLIECLLFDYINYVTSDKNFMGNNETSEQIYFLRELRDKIRLCTQEPAEE